MKASDSPQAFPPRLLLEVAWDFEGHHAFATLDAFETAVAAHLLENASDEPPDLPPASRWAPMAMALASPFVSLRYYADPADQPAGYRTVVLCADSPAGFSCRELLFKIHNAVIARLSTSGHHWFEGLEFSGLTPEGVPEYDLIPGS